MFGFGNSIYADCTPGSCPAGEVCRIMGTDGKKTCEPSKTLKGKGGQLKMEGSKSSGGLGKNKAPKDQYSDGVSQPMVK